MINQSSNSLVRNILFEKILIMAKSYHPTSAEQLRLQVAIEAERKRIAEDMHDDLGGNLTTIQLLLQKIKKEDLPSHVVNDIKRIEAYALASITSLRHIIWTMNSSYDEIAPFMAFIRRFMIEYLEDHNLVCQTNLITDIPNKSIKGEIRRHILLLIKELLHNIVKHAKATKVEVNFQWDDGLNISIHDNGKGFKFTEKPVSGNGIRNIKHRLDKINGCINYSDRGRRIDLEFKV